MQYSIDLYFLKNINLKSIFLSKVVIEFLEKKEEPLTIRHYIHSTKNTYYLSC
jgi:hypothetical protein